MLVEVIYFDDVEVGYVSESAEVAVDREEMIAYAKRNDPWPIHIDEGAAAASPFGDVIASFGYVVSLYFRLIHGLEINQASQEAFLGALEWNVQFKGPVRADDRLRVRATVAAKRVSSRGDRGVVTTRQEVLNQRDELRVVIDVAYLLRRRPDGAAG